MTDGASGLGTWVFVGTIVFFSLLWTFTLVSFALALSFRPQPARGVPRSVDELRAALLELRGAQGDWRLMPLSATALRLHWDVVDASWYELFTKVKFSVVYRMRVFLEESTHEVRTYESIRTGSVFLGFVDWRPTFQWSWTYAGGALNVIWSGVAYGITHGFPPRIGRIYTFTLDTAQVKREIEAVANERGWTLYPTTLPFEVSPWAVRLGALLTPSFMRTWSRRRFWTTLHGLSWAGILTSTLAYVPWTLHNFAIMALVFGGIVVMCAAIIGTWRLIDRASAARTRKKRRVATASRR